MGFVIGWHKLAFLKTVRSVQLDKYKLPVNSGSIGYCPGLQTQTFIFEPSLGIHLYITIFEDESLQDERNNVWMSICSLVNEYLKMNGNAWKWKFRVWSPVYCGINNQ